LLVGEAVAAAPSEAAAVVVVVIAQAAWHYRLAVTP
jgi:hypothetical protein